MTLKDYITKKQLSIAVVSKLTNINPSLICGYMSGRVKPSLLNIVKLQKMTNGKITAKDFLDSEDKQELKQVATYEK